jgi:hypothetical protein
MTAPPDFDRAGSAGRAFHASSLTAVGAPQIGAVETRAADALFGRIDRPGL